MPRDELPLCTCGWLEEAVHDPECPVRYDPALHEYNIEANGVSWRIYHCPFCAGRAPVSLRSRLFATVSHDETTRLHRLTAGLATERDVRDALGAPSAVLEPGTTRIVPAPRTVDEPEHIWTYRELLYDNHSETATICVEVDRDGRARISFRGKPLARSGP